MFVVPQLAIDSKGLVNVVAPTESESSVGADLIELAGELILAGAKIIQLRDTDGCLAIDPANLSWLEMMLEEVSVPVQIDSSGDNASTLAHLATMKTHSIVVGSHVLFDPMALRWAHDLLGSRIIVELLMDGEYLFDPPKGSYALELDEAARRLAFQGIQRVLIRDVTGNNLPLSQLERIVRGRKLELWFSGNIKQIGDFSTLDAIGVHAVLVGAPLFDGRININDVCWFTESTRT